MLCFYFTCGNLLTDHALILMVVAALMMLIWAILKLLDLISYVRPSLKLHLLVMLFNTEIYRNHEGERLGPILWNFPRVVVSPQTWRLLTHTRRWRPYRNCFRCRNDVLHFVWQISNYSVSVLNLLSSWLRYIDVVPIFVNKKKKKKNIDALLYLSPICCGACIWK